MQTGKKKLCRPPDANTDKVLVVVDNSAGPVALVGEFLTLNFQRVDYPIGSSTQEVIKKYDSYIGLGKFVDSISEEEKHLDGLSS